MNIITTIKRWISMHFLSKAKEEFNIKPIVSASMESFVNQCARIYEGNPDWTDEHIKTVNFAKTICDETAKLATLATKITIDGSPRAEWLQFQIDKVYYQLRNWVEYACAYGTIVLKPNGDSIDCLLPKDFSVTEQRNGKVIGAVFYILAMSSDGKEFYTRLEYHRFINDTYVITNKCYRSNTQKDIGKPIDIIDTPWNLLKDEVFISGLETPLFSVLRMNGANNIDVNSPMGMPAFSDAIEELKDLDVAYSRNAKEIFDSKRIVLMDSDRLLPTKGGANNVMAWENTRNVMELPDYVRNVYGDGQNSFYQEINPTLNTTVRMDGINALLSQIGFKCGFSNGYFVFNQKTGMVTATQVESDDRRTIQTIKDIRDALESAMNDLIYALDKFADLYDLSPVGAYEVTYDFGDITYSREEDRIRWWNYVQAGKVPAWQYFVKFEGLSEEEAKAMTSEATQSMGTDLFGVE